MNDLERNRVDEICSLHTEIAGSCRMALDKAIRIGELLAEHKASLPHGEFGRWIQEHLPFSDRTARNYMRCYESRELLKTESVSGLGTAYLLLTQPKLPAPNSAADGDVLWESWMRQGRDLLERANNIPDMEERANMLIAVVNAGQEMLQGLMELLLDMDVRIGELLCEEAASHE